MSDGADRGGRVDLEKWEYKLICQSILLAEVSGCRAMSEDSSIHMVFPYLLVPDVGWR